MTAYNPRLRDLGAELRAARERVKLTQPQVAERINRHQSQISRWEQGRLLPSEADLGAMFVVYEITSEEEQNRLLTMARETADPNYVLPGVGPRLAALIANERDARRIVNVEPLIIPGLCQTADYTRAIALGMGATQEQADQRVQTRLRRQALFSRDRAPNYLAIIGEHALRYPPRACDTTVMAGQLEKLLTFSARPNVSILVLPLANVADTPAVYGSYVLMEMRRGAPVVQHEPYRSITILAGRRDVRDYQAAEDEIRRNAMSATGSVAFIERLLKELER